jgi:hypothetical protein
VVTLTVLLPFDPVASRLQKKLQLHFQSRANCAKKRAPLHPLVVKFSYKKLAFGRIRADKSGEWQR